MPRKDLIGQAARNAPSIGQPRIRRGFARINGQTPRAMRRKLGNRHVRDGAFGDKGLGQGGMAWPGQSSDQIAGPCRIIPQGMGQGHRIRRHHRRDGPFPAFIPSLRRACLHPCHPCPC